MSFSASLLAAGCLDAPPEYSVPEQIPPIIPAGLVDPNPGEVHEIRPGQIDQKFNVPFRSRDLDEKLSAYLYRSDPANATPEVIGDLIGGQTDIPATEDPLGEQLDRLIDLTWVFPGPNNALQGCQRLTLVLSHDSNFSNNPIRPLPLDEIRAARVTWWFNFSPETTLFSDCLAQQLAP